MSVQNKLSVIRRQTLQKTDPAFLGPFGQNKWCTRTVDWGAFISGEETRKKRKEDKKEEERKEDKKGREKRKRKRERKRKRKKEENDLER